MSLLLLLVLGVPLESIDLGCIGPQKDLSCAPSLCAVTVSNKAWDKIKVIIKVTMLSSHGKILYKKNT